MDEMFVHGKKLFALADQVEARLTAAQRQVDALKRSQAETALKDTGQAAADPPSFHFVATRLDALLPSILDRAFKGGL